MSKDKVPNRKWWERFINRYVLRFWWFYLLHFDFTHIIKRALLARKDRGYPECVDCGLCCLNCEALEDKKCKLWKFTHGLFTCGYFPQHPLFLKFEKLEGKCRYYWEKDWRGR